VCTPLDETVEFYIKVHRHTGVGRYPVFFPAWAGMTAWITDQVRNDMRYFHASLYPIWAWPLVGREDEFVVKVRRVGENMKSGVQEPKLTNAGGAVAGISASAEAHLVLAELAAVYEYAPIAMLLVDRDVRAVRVNAYAANLAGRPREEMIGMVVGEAMRCIHHLENPKGCGFSSSCETCPIRLAVSSSFTDKQGRENVEVWLTIVKGVDKDERCLLLSTSYLDGEGLERVLLCARDITHQKKAEDALRQSEERWQFALEGSGDGVWDWNVETNEVFYSRQLKAMLGYAEDEISNNLSEWDSRLHPEDRDYVYGELKKHFEGISSVYVSEHRLRCKDGSYKWILDRGKVISRTEDGRPLRVIGTHTDISARKEAEFERERLEAQLIQAQKMESVGRLAGGVAHDYNNMLGVIIGHAELGLAELGAESPVSDDLEQILKAAQRSADITRKLLGFARKQTISPKILDLNDTVTGMLKMLRRLIGEEFQIAWMPGGNLSPIKMDPSQLDQILANLCVNSKDAMAKGGNITIRTGKAHLDEAYCSAHAGFVPGEYVMLSVSDEGCGMGKETLDHIFEPFFTTKEVGKGTGLGLSTVYGIVKQNNGFINVYSEPGKGTTAKIYFVPQRLETTENMHASGSGIVRGKNETILLVEDDRGILDITHSMLERLGYRVISAQSPKEALLLSKRDPSEINLLMTDVVMPDMDGKELASLLKVERPGLITLFMSGYTSEVVLRHGIVDKGDKFISKPFSVSELAAKLRETLDNRN